ncbi:hypothetical protein [Streptomyces sp. Amel2xC10]|uniref:hypothetical protein n=1 Tax=Streptomyces sp. Amel2xC10 TaxID=1305826 RepID=UPI000A08B4D5|nr:hypothetical protein SAMN02745830_04643 [Streptomyces sp. Amel2xC10]
MGDARPVARESARRPAEAHRRGAVVAALMLAMALAALDSVTRALDAGAAETGTAHEAVRHAVASAVHAVYLGAAGAAALAFVVLLWVAPRRFPVLREPGG